MQQKPKGFVDGVGKGGKAFGSSIVEGFKGVYTKPRDGVISGGFGGFMKGIGQGLAGVLVKPTVGAVDMISKTTQGLERECSERSECADKFKRVRAPRAFYDFHKAVKIYNETDALAYGLIKDESYFMKAFHARKITTQPLILLFTSQTLIAIEAGNKTTWSMKTANITVVEK